MSLDSNQSITTADQLLSMPNDGNRYELVNGYLRMMSPAGSEHGWIAGRILARLAAHVEKHNLGKAYAAETGFRIGSSPDTVLTPDASFVSQSRLASVKPTRGYLPVAPDLVVEVVSPSDASSEIESKVDQWLKAGTIAVLIADPAKQTIRVYRHESRMEVLRRGDTFAAGDACSDWTLAVNDAFQIETERG